jgi:hypothetical protein
LTEVKVKFHITLTDVWDRSYFDTDEAWNEFLNKAKTDPDSVINLSKEWLEDLDTYEVYDMVFNELDRTKPVVVITDDDENDIEEEER